jgi:hypothetical protein
VITVHNLVDGKPTGVCEYVGRPRSLGNSYVVGRDGNRHQVIDRFKRDLWGEIKTGRGPRVNALLRLRALAERGDLHLLCHCKPLACHADVIKAVLEWMIRTRWQPPT